MRRLMLVAVLSLAVICGACDDSSEPASGGQPLVDTTDTDRDGFYDSYDLHPNGEDVRDADGDRISDAYDRYPTGQDQIDTDGDGYPDVYDREPQTPRTVPAPPNGTVPAPTRTPGPPVATTPSPPAEPDLEESPKDTDNDGLPDSRDVNPTTPENSDPDGDGVLTRDDRWPHDSGNDTDSDGEPNLFDRAPTNDARD
jgi:hypothetical protein